MSLITPVFKREFYGYFRSPVAYVFVSVFLVAAVVLTFFIGNFFESNVASLQTFFTFHPWLFLFLAPAVGMRLWSEEKRTGTLELLFTLPITPLDAVMGKFLAAWAFLCATIALSFPLALTAGYLGDPDWGILLTGYLGSMLMAGAYLGVCSLTSAFTKNQVIAFVLGLVVCVLLAFLGFGAFSNLLADYLPIGVVDALANFSFLPHFENFTRGIIDPGDVIFFLSLPAFCLLATVLVLEP